MTMEGESYHKSCFKCAHGGCPLTHSSYAALDGVLYCKHHFQQLFMEKGNYQHVLDAASHKKSASMEAVDVDVDVPAAAAPAPAPAAEDQAEAAEDDAAPPPPEEKKPADDDDDDSEKPPAEQS